MTQNDHHDSQDHPAYYDDHDEVFSSLVFGLMVAVLIFLFAFFLVTL